MVFSDRFEEVRQQEITQALPKQTEYPNLTEKLDLDNFHDIIEGFNIGYPEDMRSMILQGQILNGETLLRATENLHINIADLESMLDDMEGDTFSAEMIFRYMNKTAYPGLQPVMQHFLCANNNDYETISETVAKHINTPNRDIDDEIGSASVFAPDTVADYSSYLQTESVNIFNEDYSLTDLSAGVFNTTETSDTHAKALRSDSCKKTMQNLFRDINMLITYLKQFSGKTEDELEAKPEKATANNPEKRPLISSEPQILHNDYIEEIEIKPPTSKNNEELAELIEEHDEADDENLIFGALFQESCSMFGMNHHQYLSMEDGTPTLDLSEVELSSDHADFLIKMYKLYAYNTYADEGKKEAFYYDIAGDNITETLHNIHSYKIATKQENWRDRDLQTYEQIRLETIQKTARSQEKIKTDVTNNIKSYIGEYSDAATCLKEFKKTKFDNTGYLKKLKTDINAHSVSLTGANRPKKQRLLSNIIRDINEYQNYEQNRVLQVTSMIFTSHTHQNMAERNDWWGPLSLITNDHEMSITPLDLQGGIQSEIEQSNLVQAGANEGQFHQRLLEECKDRETGQLKLAKLKTTLKRYADQAARSVVNLPGLDHTHLKEDKITALKTKIDILNFNDLNTSEIRILKQGAFADTMYENLALQLQEYRNTQKIDSNTDSLDEQKAIAEIATKLGLKNTVVRQTLHDMFKAQTMRPQLMHQGIVNAIKANPTFANQLKNAGSINVPIFYNDGQFSAGAHASAQGAGLYFNVNVQLGNLGKSKVVFKSVNGFGVQYDQLSSGDLTGAFTHLLGAVEVQLGLDTETVRPVFRNILAGGGATMGFVPYAHIQANIFDTHEYAQYSQFQTALENSKVLKENQDSDNVEKAYRLLKHIAAQGGASPEDIKTLESDEFALNLKDNVKQVLKQFATYIQGNLTPKEKAHMKNKLYTQLANKILDVAESNIVGAKLDAHLYIFPGLMIPSIAPGVSWNTSLIKQQHTTQQALEQVRKRKNIDLSEGDRAGLMRFQGIETRALLKGETTLDKNPQFLKILTENGLRYETQNGKHYLTLDPNQYPSSRVELSLGKGVALNNRTNKSDRVQFDPSKPLYIDKISLTSGSSKGMIALSISTDKNEDAATLRRKATGMITIKSRKRKDGTFIRQSHFQSFTGSQEATSHQIPSSINITQHDTSELITARKTNVDAAKRNAAIKDSTKRLVEKFARNPKRLQAIIKARITKTNGVINTKSLQTAIIDFAKYVNNYWVSKGKEKVFDITDLQQDLQPGNSNFEYLVAHLNPASIEQLASNMKSQAEVHKHASNCAQSLKPIIKDLTGIDINLMDGITQNMMPATPSKARTSAATLKGYTILATRLPLTGDKTKRDKTRGVQPFDIRSEDGTEVELLQFKTSGAGKPVTDARLKAAHKLWDKSANIGTNGYSRTESKLISLQSKVHGVERSPLADLLGQNTIPTGSDELTKWKGLMNQIHNAGPNAKITIKDKAGNIKGYLNVQKAAQVVMLANCANPSLAFKMDLNYTPVTPVVGNYRRGSHHVMGGRIKRGASIEIGLPYADKNKPNSPDKSQDTSQNTPSETTAKPVTTQNTGGGATIDL